MLQIQNLRYTIGDRELLAGIDWVVQPHRRTALIGPNGTGKSTLLKILTGNLEPSAVEIVKPKLYNIGYLPQEEIAATRGTVLESVTAGREEVKSLEKQIREIHQALDSAAADQSALLDRLGTLEQRYQALDGYHLESAAKAILSGLGLLKDDFDRPLAEFSGGRRMRAYLALLLLQKPDLLLLDEPTNHLDISSVEWLEQYLLNFPGSIILVSHDRFFIDRLAQEILELEGGRLERYPGNYRLYEEKKEERRLLLEKKWLEQQEERARQERFINRFRYKNTKATQVQSRIKQLEKLGDIVLPPPPPRLDFKLSAAVRSYKDVLEMKDVHFAYDESASWQMVNVNLSIYRGEKCALIGPNGAGKTTLTKLVTGQLQPDSGTVRTGERVIIGYYAQHQVEALDLGARIFDEVAATAAESHGGRIRDMLGVFQFRGDDVFKKIKVLSGGEKARVSLAKILLSPVNFLIMDEPTTHLDKIAKEALEHALYHFDGTLMLISHDRYFLDKLVQRVIEVKDGKLEEFHGNYSYYLDKRQHQEEAARSEDESRDDTPAAPGSKKSKEQKRLEAEARQAVSKEVNRLKTQIDDLERRIGELEGRIAGIEAEMARPETYDDKELTVALQKEYADKNKELDIANRDWETAQLELEEILAQLPHSARSG